MAVQDINIKRGGKAAIAKIGITQDGQSRLSIDNVEPDIGSGQKIRKFPKRLIIEFDEGEGNGAVSSIRTIWKETMVSNTNKPIHATGRELIMLTNADDIAAFISMFGQPILMSMLNGFYRAIEGFNDKPVFNSATGAVLTYTAAQEAEEPTGDYYGPVTPAPDGTDTPNP